MTSYGFDSILDLLGDRDITESEVIHHLKSILRGNTEVLNEKDEAGRTLLHGAAARGYVEMIKLLVELNEDLVKTDNNAGQLPIHYACRYCKAEAVKYLYSIHPESIIIADDGGYYPLHRMLNGINNCDREDLTRFLLLHDQGAASKPTLRGGRLPLHIACNFGEPLEIVEMVYNAHPQAIHTRDNAGRTPLDHVRLYRERDEHTSRNAEIIDFFETQLELYRQALEQRHLYDQGQLPIHRALLSGNLPIGTIKLMAAANPQGLLVTDKQGRSPLHIAIQSGQVDIALLLIDVNQNTLKVASSSGDLPLHLACLEGYCNLVNFILERDVYGVSRTNADGKLPIHALIFHADCDRDSLEYIDAIARLLNANPESSIGLFS